MDWSSVFEDEGDETGEWARSSNELSVASSRANVLSLFESYTPLICYAFTVNYILGVGCLGIPYAFLQSGIILGTILIIALSFISYITVLWVAAATQQEIKISSYNLNKYANPFIISPYISSAKRKRLSRGSANNKSSHAEKKSLVTRTSSSNFNENVSSAYKSISKENLVNLERSGVELNSKNNNSAGDKSDRSQFKKSVLTNNHDIHMDIHELEVMDLVEEFLGFWGKVGYQGPLMTLTYVGLLAYCQVFNGTFISQLWPSAPAFLPPFIFSVIVVPLSCFDLSEQIAAQVTMSILRFCALGALLFGTCFALVFDWEHAAANQHSSFRVSKVDSPTPVPLLDWQGFGVMFTTAIFSQLFQHSVPGLIRPLSEENKRHIPAIFKYAVLTTASLYISTGIVCVLYFGDKVQQSVNLNFVDFFWGADVQTLSVVTFVCLKAVSMTVVLFPALDTLSVFPLIAITLGNNLNAAFPGLSGVLVDHSPLLGKKVH